MKNSNTVSAAPDTLTDGTVAFVNGYAYGIRYAPEEAHVHPCLWAVFTPNMTTFCNTQEEAQIQLLDNLLLTEDVEWISPRPAWTLPGSPVATALAASSPAPGNSAASMPAVSNDDPAPAMSTRFAPLPIGPYEPASKLEDGQASAHGSCSTYCTTGHWDGKPSGMEVSEHGPWCESQARGYVRGFSEMGSPRESSASLVRRYLHGTYNYTGRQLHQEPAEFVRIEIYEQGVSVFQFLPIGEAYRLGAALTALARSADSLDVSLDARS